MSCQNCPKLAAKVAALEVELAAERARPRPGRAPKEPIDERGKLVAAACRALGVSRGQLAERLGIARARLSPSGTFPAARREALMAQLAELAAYK